MFCCCFITGMQTIFHKTLVMAHSTIEEIIENLSRIETLFNNAVVNLFLRISD